MIQAFLESPWPMIIAVLGIALFFGALILAIQVIQEKSKISKRKAYWAGRKQRSGNSKTDYAADQLKTVSQAKFIARPLLNQKEANVFQSMEAVVRDLNPNWRVMAQVNLGEVLRSPDDSAFRAVNSKRVDFALMDENCCVRHALEYQGSGHHTGSSAAARDAVKKEALRKAGIGYHEIIGGHTKPSDLKQLIEKLVPKCDRGTSRPRQRVPVQDRLSA